MGKAVSIEAHTDPTSVGKAAATTLRISGMDCADCAAKLEKSIQTHPQVEKARLNFGAAKLELVHRGPVEEIIRLIEAQGYQAYFEPVGPEVTGLAPAWLRNKYVLVTMLTGLLAGFALVAKYFLGLPAAVVDPLFIIGILFGVYLPAKSGTLVLLKARQLDMNALLTIAALGALGIGQFEEGAVVVFLFALGNALQGYTLDKTRNSIRALMELTPKVALVRRGQEEKLVAIEELQVGDLIIVRPGERIPMDGQVLAGTTTVNQAPITGESLPVEKQIGDEVFAGSINQSGALEIKVTKLAKDNTMARIIHLVEEAQAQRAPSQQFVDRFARYYTPLVILGAVLLASLPTLFFQQPFHKWFYEALAVLLVACPCALVISTPVSLVSAIGTAARNGVLIKGGAYLEETGALSVVAFDKTGTLTRGKPWVTDVMPLYKLNKNQVLSLAAAVEARSEHPLAMAVVAYTEAEGIKIPPVSRFKAMPGRGAWAVVNGEKYYMAKPGYFREKDYNLEDAEETMDRLQQQGKTVTVLSDGEKVLGLIALADIPRENSLEALTELKKIGIKKLVMLTGDNLQTACAVANQVGVDEVKADLLPTEKLEALKTLLAENTKVAMVGDGINDAPALARATVGIAMGAVGTDTALETADIALMTDDLSRLPYAIKLSRQTLRVIKQNIAFSLLIKGCILLLVIPGWLTLWLAIVADMGSSLLVTFNGMRLLKYRYK